MSHRNNLAIPDAKRLARLDKEFIELRGDLVCAGNLFSKAARSGPIDANVYLEIVQEFEDVINQLSETLEDPGNAAQFMRTRACFVDFLRNSYPVDGERHHELFTTVYNQRSELLKESRVQQANLVINPPPEAFCFSKFVSTKKDAAILAVVVFISAQTLYSVYWLIRYVCTVISLAYSLVL